MNARDLGIIIFCLVIGFFGVLLLGSAVWEILSAIWIGIKSIIKNSDTVLAIVALIIIGFILIYISAWVISTRFPKNR
jgi:hypothetical protein